MKYALIMIPILLLTNGCATIEQSTFLGAGVGIASGTGIGLAIERSPGSAIIGASIGAVLGSAAFYLLAKDHEKKNALAKLAQKETTEKGDPIPAITRPEIICHKVDGHIEESGTLWTGPHLRCEIKKQSVWSR